MTGTIISGSMITGAVALFAASMFLGTPASAVVANCDTISPDVTGTVVANSGCQFSDFGPNQHTVTDINNEAFFGMSNWVAKTSQGGLTGTGTDIDLSVTFTDPNDAGTWSILNFDSNLDYLLVFKDGNNKTPSSLIGYLIETMSGSFGNPFYNCNPQGCSIAPDAISNITLFAKPAPIPLPAALPLFLVALAGTGLIARRRKDLI